MTTAPRELSIVPSSGVTFADGNRTDVKGWQPDTSLSVSLAPPVLAGRHLVLTWTLRNAGPAPVIAYTLSGGAVGLSTNPVSARLDVPERATSAVRGPEVYPYPKKVTLPPSGEVRYELRICLDDLVGVAPGCVVGIDWSFELWSDRRTGHTQVTLP